jgi:hypothetical protein
MLCGFGRPRLPPDRSHETVLDWPILETWDPRAASSAEVIAGQQTNSLVKLDGPACIPTPGLLFQGAPWGNARPSALLQRRALEQLDFVLDFLFR